MGRTAGILALLAIAIAPLWLANWVVDDAAISFAFAENLVGGEGWVAVPGGERVEGYSNPLWVLLLAVGASFGFDLFFFSKGLATLCAVGAGAWAWRGAGSWLAPALLALGAPFVIWNASGLENPLFSLLLLAGLVLGKEGRFGWAGLVFGLLSLTRPEALVYGLVAGGLHTARGVNTKRFWPGLLGLFLVHEGFRLWYFAWPLPNTYYAKLGTPIERWSWTARGVRQVQSWAWESGMGVLLPLLLLGAQRRWVVGVLALLPLAFSVYAGGDWMRGYRWMSLAAGPLAWLLAEGLLEVHRRWGRRVQWIAGGLVFGGLIPSQFLAVRGFAKHPVDYPEMIDRRVRYLNRIADRLQIPPRDRSTLDMDMGAHLWLSDLAVVDLAGLVDVPIAHHSFDDRAFFQQYIFEEKRPLFAHVHRHWAKVSGLPSYPGWKDYLALPPYPDDGRKHGGVFVRRDVFEQEWDGDRLDVELAGLRVVGVRMVDTVQHELQVELAFESLKAGSKQVELEIDGLRHPIEPTHGLLPPKRWRGTVVATHVLPVASALGWRPVTLWVGDQSLPLPPIEVVPDITPHATHALEGVTGPDCDAAERAWKQVLAYRPSAAWVEDAGGPRRIAQCWLDRGGLQDLVRARYWDRAVPGYAAQIRPWVQQRYADGLAAEARGERSQAYQAFRDVLSLQPQHAWARRHAEAVR